MASERAEFVITVDATQARAELERTRAAGEAAVTSYGSFEKAGTAVVESSKKLGGYLAETTKKVSEHKYEVEAASIKTGIFGDGWKKIQPTLGASAAAVSTISSALGAQAGKTGQVINLGGQMLAAFSAGGPYGLALAAGIVGVTTLTKHWDDLIKKEDEALRKQYLATDDASALLNKVDDDITALRAKTQNSSAQAYASVQIEIDQAQRKQDEIKKKLLSDSDARRAKMLADAGMNAEVNQALVDENNNRKQAIGILDKVIEKLQVKQGLESAVAASGTGGDVAKTLNDKAQALAQQRALAELGAQAALADQLDALYSARLQRRADDEQTLIQESIDLYHQLGYGQENAEQDSLAVHERYMKERIAMDQQFAAAAMELTQHAMVDPVVAGAGTATSVLQTYLDAKVTGTKNAEAAAAAEFLKGIGSNLVGIGLQSEVSGAAKLFNPATAPIGVLEMGFGAGAIALGLGLGAGGSAIGHVGAGGTIGQALPGTKATGGAATDRGVNGGGSGSRGGGGTMVINITGGALVGPSPQDQGRAVLDVLRRYGAAAGSAGFQNIQGPRR